MLKALKVDSYKCLRFTELVPESSGLTVLLGPNGSGKSSLFGALSLAWRLAYEGAQSLHPYDDFVRVVPGGDPSGTIDLAAQIHPPEANAPVSWRVSVQNRPGRLFIEEELRSGRSLITRKRDNEVYVERGAKFSLPDSSATLCSFARRVGSGELSSPDPEFGQTIVPVADRVRESLGPVRIVSLNPTAIALPTLVGAPVETNGQGLPAALNLLSSTRRGVFKEIEDAFRGFFPWVEEIEVPALQKDYYASAANDPSDQPKVYLSFREKGAKGPYPASETASGMLISLALLWMVLRPDPDKIICYDEPENSIHPYLLEKVYGLLRGAARGEFGRPPVQVFVATHSVDFVNLCEPNEIRICERSDDGINVTSVSDRKDLAEAVSNYRGAMGELWNSGALGGVPHGAKNSRSG